MFRNLMRATLITAVIFCVLPVAHAQSPASSRHLAPGFSSRPMASSLVVVPVDMELFSLSAGGVAEPRADWTEFAQKHFKMGLDAHKTVLGPNVRSLPDTDMDEFTQLNALHGAVAEAIFTHHMTTARALPTKAGVLDWTLGEAVEPLRAKTGADYALFFWIRDSYASAERKATMIVMAMVGVGITGGIQVGYASLVDLRDGRVVWFNNLARMSGDLREAKPAEETVEALLKGFPLTQ